MIPRYTLPEMGAIWSEATRFRLFVEVEVAVVRTRARRGLVPAEETTPLQPMSPYGRSKLMTEWMLASRRPRRPRRSGSTSSTPSCTTT